MLTGHDYQYFQNEQISNQFQVLDVGQHSLGAGLGMALKHAIAITLLHCFICFVYSIFHTGKLLSTWSSSEMDFQQFQIKCKSHEKPIWTKAWWQLYYTQYFGHPLLVFFCNITHKNNSSIVRRIVLQYRTTEC